MFPMFALPMASNRFDDTRRARVEHSSGRARARALHIRESMSQPGDVGKFVRQADQTAEDPDRPACPPLEKLRMTGLVGRRGVFGLLDSPTRWAHIAGMRKSLAGALAAILALSASATSHAALRQGARAPMITTQGALDG